MRGNDVIGILFAYVHEERVRELTQNRVMASIPYGGRYRLVDFPLSNIELRNQQGGRHHRAELPIPDGPLGLWQVLGPFPQAGGPVPAAPLWRGDHAHRGEDQLPGLHHAVFAQSEEEYRAPLRLRHGGQHRL